MTIDFHTHFFADKIAQKAIPMLAEKSGLVPATDGTLNSTLAHMKSCGIDKAVLLPIATKPHQQNIINSWAVEFIDSDNIIPFGTVHPLCDDKIDALKALKAAGIKGIKLHPDYQDFFIDSPELDDVYDECGKLGLIVAFHAGLDIGFPETVHAPAKSIASAVKRHPDTIFSAAHFGGFFDYKQVLDKLCGLKNLYFDTAFAARYLKPEAAVEIIKAHGAEKILLGSDCPWESPKDSVAFIESLAISEHEKELIKGKNAIKLLGLEN